MPIDQCYDDPWLEVSIMCHFTAAWQFKGHSLRWATLIHNTTPLNPVLGIANNKLQDTLPTS